MEIKHYFARLLVKIHKRTHSIQNKVSNAWALPHNVMEEKFHGGVCHLEPNSREALVGGLGASSFLMHHTSSEQWRSQPQHEGSLLPLSPFSPFPSLLLLLPLCLQWSSWGRGAWAPQAPPLPPSKGLTATVGENKPIRLRGILGTDLIVVVHFSCGGNPAVWQENK